MNNSFSTNKNKLSKIWNNTQDNVNKINVQRFEQKFIVTELGRTQVKQGMSNGIDLTSSWGTLIKDTEDSLAGQVVVDRAYKRWEIDLRGIGLAQLFGVSFSYNLRFSGGSVDWVFDASTSVITRSVVEPRFITGDTINNFTYHFGLYIHDQSENWVDLNTHQIEAQLIIHLTNPIVCS